MSQGNIAWHIWVGTICTLVPATLSVATRFAARLTNHGLRLWWDDWLILASLVCNPS